MFVSYSDLSSIRMEIEHNIASPFAQEIFTMLLNAFNARKDLDETCKDIDKD